MTRDSPEKPRTPQVDSGGAGGAAGSPAAPLGFALRSVTWAPEAHYESAATWRTAEDSPPQHDPRHRRRPLSRQELAELRRMPRYLPERPPRDTDVADLSDDASFGRMLAAAAAEGVDATFFSIAMSLLQDHPQQTGDSQLRALCAALRAVGYEVDADRRPRLSPVGTAAAVALAWSASPLSRRPGARDRAAAALQVKLQSALRDTLPPELVRLGQQRSASLDVLALNLQRDSGLRPGAEDPDGAHDAATSPMLAIPQRAGWHPIPSERSPPESLMQSPKVHLAAMYIQDALEFQPKRTYRETPHAMRAHRKRLMLHYLIWLDIAGLLALAFISEPLWCRGTGHCQDDRYMRWRIDVVGTTAELTWEGLSLLLLLYDYYLWLVVLGLTEVRKWRIRVCHGVVLLAHTIDFLVAISRDTIHFRLSIYLRVFYGVAYSNTLQRQFWFLARAMPEFAKILTLLCAFVICFAWFGVVFFPNDGEEGLKYFHEFGEAMWNLMDLLTTNNFPDVMMPAYTVNRLYVLYFVAYLFFGLWMIVNLFIALVNQAFSESAERERLDMLRNQSECIAEAFRLLVPAGGEEGDEEATIDRHLMLAVFAELNNNSSVRYIPNTEANILFGLLDNTGDCKIDIREFSYLPFMMHLEFDEKSLRDHGWLPTYCPCVERWPAWGWLRDTVRSARFEQAVDVILVLNAVLVVIETRKFLVGEVETDDDIDQQRHGWQGALDFTFSILYVVEMLLKIAVDGWNYYWGQLRNMFDGTVTLLALGSTIYILLPNGYDNTDVLRWFIMARLGRVVRLVGHVPQFAVIFGTLVLILPDVRKVLTMLFCIMYFFTCLGCDLFGGLLNKDPDSEYYQRLVNANTTYAANQWYPLNFNDIGSGMVMLFSCLVMNNWDNYVISYAVVTSKWARVYFVAFWVLGYVTCFNIVISAILNKWTERSRSYRKSRSDHKARSGWTVRAERKGTFSETFGVTLESFEGDAEQPHPVVVCDVQEGGPADAAGVAPGCMLVAVNGAQVRKLGDVEPALALADPAEAMFEVEVHMGDDGWGHFNPQRITQTETGESADREFRVRYAGDEALLRTAAEAQGLLPEGEMDGAGFIRHVFTQQSVVASPRSVSAGESATPTPQDPQ
eukprot:TRINITY_DN28492_c0_g1_i1.p1 TRINITY_DN28492_c0_g1~~TRINITY_DN28492_c0_g1_i1.p1  ORF type:complete len:1154 (+),score=369.42 TRINITY_DN28492_c0_g1_i1:80-3463(+)